MRRTWILLVTGAVLAATAASAHQPGRHAVAGAVTLALSNRAGCSQCARTIVFAGSEGAAVTNDGLGLALDCFEVEQVGEVHRVYGRAVNGGGSLAFAILVEDGPEGVRGSWDFVPVQLDRCGVDRLSAHAAAGVLRVLDGP